MMPAFPPKKVVETALVILCLAAGAVIPFAPALFSSKLLFDTDTLTYDYPTFLRLQNSQIAPRGWNPLYLMGYPDGTSPVDSSRDVLNHWLVNSLEDPFLAYHLRLVIAAAIGLFFAYLFGRAAGISRLGSLALAYAYLIGQTLTGFSGGLVNANAFYVLPMLLYAAISFHRGKSFMGHAPLAAALLAFGWYAGFVQTIFYACLIAFAYALYLDIFRAPADPPRFRWRAIAGILAIAAASVVLAFPFLLPSILFRSNTLRVAGFGGQNIDGLAIGDLMTWLLPDYVRIPHLTSSVNAGIYIGAAPFLLAAAALFGFFRARAVVFFAAAYLFILAILLKPLGISAVLQHLPVFSSFHTVKRWLLPGSFLLAYLAAYGFDRLTAPDGAAVKEKIKTSLLWLTGMLAAFFIGVIALNIFFAVFNWRDQAWQNKILAVVLPRAAPSGTAFDMTHYRAVFARALAETQKTVSLAEWRFSLPLILLLLGIAFLWLFYRGKMEQKLFRGLMIGLVLVNLPLVYGAQYERFVPREEYLKAPRITAFFSADRQPYRLISFLTGEAAFREVEAKRPVSSLDNFKMARERLVSNLNLVSGAARADGYEPFIGARQHKIWREVIAPEDLSVPGGFKRTDDKLAEKKEDFFSHRALISAYNIRYILSGYPLDAPRLLKISAPPETFSGAPLFLYENADFLPRVYVPRRVRVAKRWDDAFFREIDASAAVAAVVECGSCNEQTASQKGSIENFTYGDEAVDFKVNAETAAWVVFSESNLPGWSAAIDGVPAPIQAANYVTQAVLVPPGAHRVRIEYRAPTFPENLRRFWRSISKTLFS